MVTVPAPFAASTIAREGPAGEAWLHTLPNLVRDCCDQWGLVVDGAPMHGYVALVVPVLRAAERLVLKVSWIDRWSEGEALALRAWDGHGAVRLLDAREDAGALLLERLNPDRTLEHTGAAEAVLVAGRLLRRLSVPPPPGIRSVAEEVADIRGGLLEQWERGARPFPRRLLDFTLDLAAASADESAARVVNQDLHYGNVLEGAREPWLVIDPKPLAGPPEFAVAPLLWTRFDDLRSRQDLERRLAMLIDTAELNSRSARAWSVVRVADYWLWAVQQQFTEDLAKCRTLLDWLAPQFAS